MFSSHLAGKIGRGKIGGGEGGKVQAVWLLPAGDSQLRGWECQEIQSSPRRAGLQVVANSESPWCQDGGVWGRW